MTVEQFLVPVIAGTDAIRAISSAVRAVSGVHLVVVSLADKTVRIEHDGSAKLEVLILAIQQAGYAEVAILV
jgi:copper chaperone CopZ